MDDWGRARSPALIERDTQDAGKCHKSWLIVLGDAR